MPAPPHPQLTPEASGRVPEGPGGRLMPPSSKGWGQYTLNHRTSTYIHHIHTTQKPQAGSDTPVTLQLTPLGDDTLGDGAAIARTQHVPSSGVSNLGWCPHLVSLLLTGCRCLLLLYKGTRLDREPTASKDQSAFSLSFLERVC